LAGDGGNHDSSYELSGRSSGRVEQAAALWLVTGHVWHRIANDSMGRVMGEEMSGRYASGERLAAIAEELTDRDWLILQTLQTVKVATGHQLQRLHFDLPETEPASASRHRRRVLQRLVDLRVLGRLERRIGGVRAGSAGFVFGVDAVGARLLVVHDGGSSRPRSVFTPGLSFLQHRLAITELYVRLTEASRGAACELIEFVAEPDCWRSFAGRGGARLLLKPDAYARVGAGGYEYLWFVEVDRAAESRPTLKAKCRRYVDYWLSGREETRSGVFPAVLWLVPDQRRADALETVIEQLPVDSRQLFKVGLFDRAVPILAGRGYADPAA
jgi:protein involved in plasmid replication-relaxation